jgi:hypothetical protein
MIGYYAHHHGLGHLTRARATIAQLDPHVRRDGVTVLSSHPGANAMRDVDVDVEFLPLDVDPPRSGACATAPPPVALHYAPLGVEGVRRRMAQMAAWVDATDPDLVVVDVSVEVAAFMRLLSVPTAVVRQHGRRDDDAHLRCYADASVLLAPYPDWLEERRIPQWMRDKTIYAGGFSRFDDHIDQVDPMQARAQLDVSQDARLVVVLDGTGGTSPWPVGQASAATPGWTWRTLGHGVTGSAWVDDPFTWLRAADVVVTHAGHNAVMEVAAARRPAIVIPQDRPYDEQGHKADLLEAAGIAEVAHRWPAPHRWPALLESAASRDVDAASRLVDGHGARRAAVALTEASRRYGRQVQHT